MKKTVILLTLLLFYPALSFCQFYMPCEIINESGITIYCTARIKETVKEVLNPVDIMLFERKEKVFEGLIPFYWNDNFIIDVSITIFEHIEKKIPEVAIGYSSLKFLYLFYAFRTIKYDPIDRFFGNNISYHIKTSQYLNYFFSELVLYDETGNILLTLDDLYEYYEGVNNPEIVTNLWTWDAKEYIITITQEMIDFCRKKYDKKNK
jgi:hypothetical protein